MKKEIGQIAFAVLILALIGLFVWLMSIISPTFLYVLLAILILLVMVTIHELGHYLAGKALKFKINEFAIGFGPKLFSYKRKNGEIFSIRLFPLGGFCAFEGEVEEEEGDSNKKSAVDPFSELNSNDDKALTTPVHSGNVYGNRYGHENAVSTSQVATSADLFEGREEVEERADLKRFNEQAPWKRIIVLFSGGLFNLLSAIVFSFIFILVVGYELPKIAKVYEVPDSPNTYYNDLMEGDVLIAVDGKKITLMNTYSELLGEVKLGESVTVTVIRGGREQDVVLLKQEITVLDENDEEVTFEGFGFQRELNFKNVSFGEALQYAVPFTGKLAWSILGAFGGIFNGRVGITDLSGPVGTIDAIADVSAMNWRNIFLLLPLIAANLGIFNLFPIPALDGSKIVFATIEWIRKRPINRNIEAIIHLVGMVVLLLFVIIIDLISFLL